MAQENISVQLNDLLTSRDFQAELLDREGRPTDAENADIFTFDYVSSTGKNYGTMVIILNTENEIQVFYGDNLGRSMEGNDKNEFFDFVQHLHKFANMRRWTYSPKNINQVKYTMQGLAAIKEGLFEGYYGTRRVSYSGEPTEARLVIQHNRTLGETDARFRYVESLFIETADTERYRLQFKNLAGGRAMLEHVRQGGKPYDVRGSHITEMVSEIATLARFNRASVGRVLEGVTAGLVSEAQVYYKNTRENLKRIGSSRGYKTYFESWHPTETTLQEELVDSIKTMFVEQTLDSRIEAALPVLARLQQENCMKEADIFESWAHRLTEGTWALPETPEQQQQLQDLMSRELIVGPDATNATEQLYDLVGDDELFDHLEQLAARDARANIWADTDVQARLAKLGIQLPAEPTADQSQPVRESRVKELVMDLEDPLMSDEEFETKYDKSREEMLQDQSDQQNVDEDAVDDFLARGGEIQQGKFRKPRKSERTDYGSRHIGGMRDAAAGKAGKTLGKAAATNFMGGGKAVVGEQGHLNEFAPGAGGDDEAGDDPYKYPKPKRYNRSADYFEQFEADHFDREDFDDDTGVFKGYWGSKQIAYFKFDNPAQTGGNNPGMGWYYEPESSGRSDDTSAAPAADNADERKQQELSMIRAFLKSGNRPNPDSQIGRLMKKYGMTEGAMPASVIRIKEKIRQMSDAEKKEYFQGKSKEQLQKMARSHGYGENSNVYAKYATQGLNEFAPPGSGDDGGDDGFSEDTLKRLAAQWWNGDEDPRVEQTLMSAGWEIGQDEGYDNGGVFVVQAGDINGKSYISWPAEELEQGVTEGSGPKEKQKTPYRDINSPEYRAAADKQKQRMAKDKAAEPGKKMLAKQGVAEGLDKQALQKELIIINKLIKVMKNSWQQQHLLQKKQELLKQLKQGVTEAADPESQKFGKYIKKYFGQIYDYGDDGLEYLDNNAPFWAMLFDKHNGDIDYIIAMEPADVLKKAALELKAMAGDLKYELDEQGVAEGWKDEADDFTEWSNHVKEKLSKASPEQRLGLAKQLSQLEVKHFGSTVPNTFNRQTGKAQAGLLTDTVRNALKYFNAEQTGIRQYYDQDLPPGTFGDKFGSVTIDGMENATPAELALMAKAVRAGADYAKAAGRIYRKTGTITQQDLDKIRKDFEDNAKKFAASIGARMDYSNRPEEPTALAQASLDRRDQAVAEGMTNADYTLQVGDEVLYRHSDPRSKMMPMPGTVLAVAPGKVTLKIYGKRTIQDLGKDTIDLDLNHYTVQPKQGAAAEGKAFVMPASMGSKEDYAARDAWIAKIQKQYPTAEIMTARSQPIAKAMITDETGNRKTIAKFPETQDVAEASVCNHTRKNEMCPEHGLTECGMHESRVQESQAGDALLARIKSLALLK